MLPEAQYGPTESSELRVGIAITRDVDGQFVAPPLRIRLQPGSVRGARVPSTRLQRPPSWQKRRPDRLVVACPAAASRRESETPSDVLRTDRKFTSSITPRRGLHAPPSLCARGLGLIVWRRLVRLDADVMADRVAETRRRNVQMLGRAGEAALFCNVKG